MMKKSANNGSMKSCSSSYCFSAEHTDYNLLEEIGNGGSAIVYRAIYVPTNEIVAVKCLDLDRCNSNLDDIRKEAQTMSLIDHPNLIQSYCSFVVEHFLWVIMPFMAEGSCLHLMQTSYTEGFEESVICSILKVTLKALEYLHKHGHIHRDIKAGNILLDNSGLVKLGDFGVSACMFDQGDRKGARNTFVGTPCWMAPEVLQPGGGYDFKADIWSFGITALELAHGHAPFSKYPPMKRVDVDDEYVTPVKIHQIFNDRILKFELSTNRRYNKSKNVLLMTLQNAPPGLDYDRDKKFSKSFKEMVAMCLVKDQTKRPTAEKLLKHSFFRNAKPPELCVKSLLSDLPPLWDRIKALQLKDAAQLALKKMPSTEQAALSQSEYQRGVSAWNFDIDDLKFQAALIQDDKDISKTKECNGSLKVFIDNKDLSTFKLTHGTKVVPDEHNGREIIHDVQGSGVTCLAKEPLEPLISVSHNFETHDESVKSRTKNELTPSMSKQGLASSNWKNQAGSKHLTYGGPLIPSSIHNSSSERGGNIIESDKNKCDVRKSPNSSGPLMLPNRASANSLSAPNRSLGGYGKPLDDKSKANMVQIKGRFSVTSQNIDPGKEIPSGPSPKSSASQVSLRKSASVGDCLVDTTQPPCINQFPKESVNRFLKETTNNSGLASILTLHLHNLLQQTSFQQNLITNMLSSLQLNGLVDVQQTGTLSQNHTTDNDMAEVTSTERERLLLLRVSELITRMSSLTDELTAERLKHIQLQEKLNGSYHEEKTSDY